MSPNPIRRTLSGKRIDNTRERPSLLGLVAARLKRAEDKAHEKQDEAHEHGPQQLVVPDGDGRRWQRRADKRRRTRQWTKADRLKAREHRALVTAAWNDPDKRKQMDEFAIDLYRDLVRSGQSPKQASRAVKKELSR